MPCIIIKAKERDQRVDVKELGKALSLIDAIILTGGMAYSKLLTEMIAEHVNFIARVETVPGENELESLAYGALRILCGEESINEYVEA